MAAVRLARMPSAPWPPLRSRLVLLLLLARRVADAQEDPDDATTQPSSPPPAAPQPPAAPPPSPALPVPPAPPPPSLPPPSRPPLPPPPSPPPPTPPEPPSSPPQPPSPPPSPAAPDYCNRSASELLVELSWTSGAQPSQPPPPSPPHEPPDQPPTPPPDEAPRPRAGPPSPPTPPPLPPPPVVIAGGERWVIEGKDAAAEHPNRGALRALVIDAAALAKADARTALQFRLDADIFVAAEAAQAGTPSQRSELALELSRALHAVRTHYDPGWSRGWSSVAQRALSSTSYHQLSPGMLEVTLPHTMERYRPPSSELVHLDLPAEFFSCGVAARQRPPATLFVRRTAVAHSTSQHHHQNSLHPTPGACTRFAGRSRAPAGAAQTRADLRARAHPRTPIHV